MKVLNNTILVNELNKYIIHFFEKEWINKKNSVFIYPNIEIFLELIISCVYNLEKNLECKKNLSKRSSVLIISRNQKLIEKIKEVNVKTSDVFVQCNRYHKVLNENGFFCDMNDKTYSMVYWRTYLSRYFNNEIPELIPLYYIMPVSRGRKNFKPISRGERNTLGRVDNIQPPTFTFSDTIKTLETKDLQEFDYIFVDGNSIKGNIDVLVKRNIPYFIYLDNPLDIRTPYLLKKENKNYIFDNFELKKFVDIEKKVELPSSDINEISFKYIKSQFEDALEEAFELLQKLQRDNFNSSDLKIIRSLLYNSIRMTIEGVEYDFIATFDPQYNSIKNLIKELKDSDFRYENLDFERIIKLIEDIFNKYQLDTVSPKYETLELIINKAIKNKESILIVASGKIDSLGLKEKISLILKVDISDLESKGIYIKSYQDVKDVQSGNFDAVILTSAIRVSDLDPILRNLGKKMIVLLYQLEIRELKSKFNMLSDIDNEFPLSDFKRYNETIYQILYKKIKRIDIDRHKELNIKIDDVLDSINRIKLDLSNRLSKPYVFENAVKAKLVTFTDDSKMFIRPGNAVRYLIKSKKDIRKDHLKNLKGNEEILIINNDIKEDLYTIFIDNVTEKNLSKFHYKNVREWRNLYEDKFFFLKLDDNKLYKKMIALGWDKSTKNVLRNWRSGYSYGPRDLEDIKILGKALDINVFIVNAEHYYKSMEHIRIERRTAARLLNKIIYLSKRSIDTSDSVFLEKYNLSLEEIQEAIKIKKMASISDETYKVKPSEVGCIF
ncbi:DISARM system-associated protein DrmE [Bacillus atrophaeus]|uniref:DISARM system-associated protein DrmE n=1 Tax=Bacillus atrophaeus TaxID=1452 RepID=UPI0028800330|nr:DISARM system-associated protein DrmE [Bacillus atrophaeus]MDS9995381.1 DISARM system-associated protein DrmE [Bacillus atrophaeus]